ncbi:MLO-like protein 13 isoform X2 [Juglans microcarpa x Juglans regia]|uniref:MLO-like protein 13 isoform X2 n=1 Tax=Juglans microcarpa x Juglans regia TaxID=2249226 RepID=UPI001B7EA7C8|nr:MLO-like protein 13 isoform X2 [Juglans microcarpa x Juglans regia]
MEAEHSSSLEYTPTWIVALVCSIIVFISLCAERALHHLGKFLTHKGQDQLHGALQKLKEELMLLGFISLLLTVFQGSISRICIPSHLASSMLPCKRDTGSSNGSEHYSHRAIRNQRQLLSEDTNTGHCLNEGKVPLLSLEALHQLHIFIFVLAVVHVIFCVTTMFLGGARIRQWKLWEDTIAHETSQSRRDPTRGSWKRTAVVSWMISFFKQFYGSLTKSDYIVLRQGFIKEYCPQLPNFDFHKYMMRTLEVDFKKVVGISWYLWLFVVVFLLLNVAGWHTYFWLSFLPLILLLFVGAKLEHVITRLAMGVEEMKRDDHEAQQVTDMARKEEEHVAVRVKPSDDHFWFRRPAIVLDIIHFILFQNSFEIAFFFWILSTYGFNSCIMEKVGYIVTRLIMGVIVQVLCSYSTLPLYAIVTQMGGKIKKGFLDDEVESSLRKWLETQSRPSEASRIQMQTMNKELTQIAQISDLATIAIEETTTSVTELPSESQ